MTRRYDGPKVRAKRAQAKARAETMAALYRDGWTLKRIGQEYGVTRQYVEQLLRRHTDITRQDGGQAKASATRRAQAKARRDASCLTKFGCTFDQWRSIPPKAKCAYTMQRLNAARRDIGWEFTIWQWWTIWRESGHWEQRGRGQGYVMCRNGDEGPYAAGNVIIAPARQNNSEQPRKKSGLPMGVSNKRGKFIAHRMFNGKKRYLGSFPTPTLAYAAYLQAGHLNKPVSSEAA